ncbi:hypothetical protein EVJ58_g5240 [Rhodofomes roseus]|uniref:Uncharacterized protein n=1 Tax=Rhodofomes roseus TaxID=34475 RepID=A0A4Y9YE62_9APHY|nr:hypothetical protein EVJ58_g5240 [Rhodofomes roseus]
MPCTTLPSAPPIDASPETLSIVQSPVNMPSIPWDPTFYAAEVCY